MELKWARILREKTTIKESEIEEVEQEEEGVVNTIDEDTDEEENNIYDKDEEENENDETMEDESIADENNSISVSRSTSTYHIQKS
eukprot:750213-Ditylum_brightwellii.AAC.1